MLRPKELVRSWVDAFNAGDADALAALYHDDAVNHQVANDPVCGRAAIREMFAEEFSAAEIYAIFALLAHSDTERKVFCGRR